LKYNKEQTQQHIFTMGNWGSNGANPKKERIVMLGLDNAGAE